MNCYWVFVFILLCLATGALAQEMLTVRVPELSAAVDIDGDVGVAEWSDAAFLCRFAVLGKESAPVSTSAYVKRDKEALFVGVICEEHQKGYPKAFLRQPTDYLGDDDAVQIVLGSADSGITRQMLMMGGYEGAMNTEAAQADHYYQFTVNSAGARSRTYNEGKLDRPLFTSAVHKTSKGWSVEMRIPFASAGINPENQNRLFFNVYRFRPPDTIGWNSQNFGGYTPMPFGRLELVERDNRTVEKPVPVVPGKDQKDIATKAEMQYYPIAQKVIAMVSGTKDMPVRAQLTVNGVKKALSVTRQNVPLEIAVKSTEPKITAELMVKSSAGKVISQDSKSFDYVAKPAWADTKVAADYVEKEVPVPWKRPEVSSSTIKLADKTLKFNKIGLLESVLSADGDLLAGGSGVILSVNGKKQNLTPKKLFSKIGGNQAVVECTSEIPGGSLSIRSSVDYDGFTVVKMRVNGVRPDSIDKLSLRIPVKSQHAQFVYRDTAQTVRELTGFGWEGKAGPVWVGGHDMGLSFDYDSQLMLSKNMRSQVQVIEAKDKTWLQVNLVDGAGQVVEQDHIFRFMLQPTPTRRPSLDKTGIYHNTALWFEEWTDYQGYPDLTKMPLVKERSEKAHAQNLLQLIYFGQVLAENAPGFDLYKNDLLAPPLRGWYKRAYDPGKDVVCYVSCARGPFGSLLLDGIEKLVDQGGIDGTYMDGTSVPWDCDNPSHIYCAGSPEINWEGPDFSPYIGTRNFLKRMRGIFDSRKKPFYMMAHTGGAINIATMSLCDGHYEGEQLARYKPGYRLSLGTFACGYSGRPWGFRTDLLPIRPIYSLEEMRTWGLLHDGAAGDGPYGEPGGAELEMRVYGEYQDDTKVKYYPYWRTQPHVDINNKNVLCSYYMKEGSAMVVLGNLTWEDQEVTVNLSDMFGASGVSVQDVVNQVPVEVTDNKLHLNLKMHRYAAYEVRPGVPEPIPASSTEASLGAPGPASFTATELKSDNWQQPENTYGVGIDRNYQFEENAASIKLTSTLYAAEASISLPGYPINSEGTVRLKIRHSGILKILVGDTGFYYGGNWTAVGLNPWNKGTLYQPKAVLDRPVEVVLSVHDGLLDATYDGKPLARELALGEKSSGIVTLATWSGDWLELTPGSVSPNPEIIYPGQVRHPVL